MKARKHNYRRTGQTEIKGGGAGKGTLSVYAFTKGDEPLEIDFEIDDWNVKQLAESIRKYMSNKEERFINDQRVLRKAMGYSTSEPNVDYTTPRT